MKQIKVKRIVYHSVATGEIFLGAEEYDGHLSDFNILNAIHEIGKTTWINGNLWVIRGDDLIYRLTVETFPQYIKTKRELFMDAVRRL